MIQENLRPKDMFLKQERLDDMKSLPRGGVRVNSRKGKENAPDRELVIDTSRYRDKAGEIGLELPFWNKVQFKTSSTKLTIEIPDNDEEDLCNRNEDRSARLAICRLEPKLIEKASPNVDGSVSSNRRDRRAICNKNAKPSNCDPEIEVMRLGNWDVINPDIDNNLFQNSANYDIQMGKLQLQESEYPRETELLQKASLEEQVGVRPLEVPNTDLAFNIGNDIGPETRWNSSAKCQESGVQIAVPLEDFFIKPPKTQTKVSAAPHFHNIHHRVDHEFKRNIKERNESNSLINQHYKQSKEREVDMRGKKENKPTRMMGIPKQSQLDETKDKVELKKSVSYTLKDNIQDATSKEYSQQHANKTVEKIYSKFFRKDSKASTEINKNVNLIIKLFDVIGKNEDFLRVLAMDQAKELATVVERLSQANQVVNLQICQMIIGKILKIVTRVQRAFISLLLTSIDPSPGHLSRGQNLLEGYLITLENILKIFTYVQANLWTVMNSDQTTEEINEHKITICYSILDLIIEIMIGLQSKSGILTPPGVTKSALKKISSQNKKLLENIEANFSHAQKLNATSKQNILSKSYSTLNETKQRNNFEMAHYQDYHSFLQSVLVIANIVQSMTEDILMGALLPPSEKQMKLSKKQHIQECHLIIHDVNNIVSHIHRIFEDLYADGQTPSEASIKRMEDTKRSMDIHLQKFSETTGKIEMSLKQKLSGFVSDLQSTKNCNLENKKKEGLDSQVSSLIQHGQDAVKNVQTLFERAYETRAINFFRRQLSIADNTWPNLRNFNFLTCLVLSDVFKEQDNIARHFNKTDEESKIDHTMNEKLIRTIALVQHLIAETYSNLLLPNPKSSDAHSLEKLKKRLPKKLQEHREKSEESTSLSSKESLTQKEKTSSKASSIDQPKIVELKISEESMEHADIGESAVPSGQSLTRISASDTTMKGTKHPEEVEEREPTLVQRVLSAFLSKEETGKEDARIVASHTDILMKEDKKEAIPETLPESGPSKNVISVEKLQQPSSEKMSKPYPVSVQASLSPENMIQLIPKFSKETQVEEDELVIKKKSEIKTGQKHDQSQKMPSCQAIGLVLSPSECNIKLMEIMEQIDEIKVAQKQRELIDSRIRSPKSSSEHIVSAEKYEELKENPTAHRTSGMNPAQEIAKNIHDSLCHSRTILEELAEGSAASLSPSDRNIVSRKHSSTHSNLASASKNKIATENEDISEIYNQSATEEAGQRETEKKSSKCSLMPEDHITEEAGSLKSGQRETEEKSCKCSLIQEDHITDDGEKKSSSLSIETDRGTESDAMSDLQDVKYCRCPARNARSDSTRLNNKHSATCKLGKFASATAAFNRKLH